MTKQTLDEEERAAAAAALGVDWSAFQDAERLLTYAAAAGKGLPERFAQALSTVRRRIDARARGGSIESAAPPSPSAGGAEGAPGPTPSDQGEAGQSKAGQSKAGQSKAGQSKAGQSKAGREEACEKGDASADAAVLFLTAYDGLVAALAPVTAQSLRDSLPPHQGNGRARTAMRFLWALAALFIALVFFVEVFMSKIGLHLAQASGDQTALPIWQILVLHAAPFAYGGFGASVYLLRSCDRAIDARSFSAESLADYRTRFLLGVIAGGMVLLFVEQLIDDGAQINLSSAALAFLAGYKVEFLYDAVDRVIGAILPKVGVESAARAGPTAAPIDPQTLLAFIDRAQSPEAKEAARTLLETIAPAQKSPGPS
ncbi:MAG: hypothetical protein NXI21_09540 [Alphaproteobacteria bacterium]|nr:hypothetical protein [Alphaproteobacteria bacterium]